MLTSEVPVCAIYTQDFFTHNVILIDHTILASHYKRVCFRSESAWLEKRERISLDKPRFSVVFDIDILHGFIHKYCEFYTFTTDSFQANFKFFVEACDRKSG